MKLEEWLRMHYDKEREDYKTNPSWSHWGRLVLARELWEARHEVETAPTVEPDPARSAPKRDDNQAPLVLELRITNPELLRYILGGEGNDPQIEVQVVSPGASEDYATAGPVGGKPSSATGAFDN